VKYKPTSDWQPNLIQLKFTADFAIDGGWHWIQFCKFQLFRKGVEQKGPLDVYVKGVLNEQNEYTGARWFNYGVRYLDCNAENVANKQLAFYDVRNGYTIRTTKELSIFDSPQVAKEGVALNGDTVVFSADAYLVHGYKTYYDVNWNMKGVMGGSGVMATWDYTTIKGMPSSENLTEPWEYLIGYQNIDPKTGVLPGPAMIGNPLFPDQS